MSATFAAGPVRRRLERPATQMALRLLMLAGVLVAWEYAPVSRPIRFWLSSPSMIMVTLVEWFADGTIWLHMASTLKVMAQGYAFGCVTGVAGGFALGLIPQVQRVVAPFLAALFALPKIALAPLFIILLGVDTASKIALVGVTVFFLVLNSTMDGLRYVDRDVVDALRIMGANPRELIVKVLVRSALPWIFTGMRIAVRYAFTATLLAELIAANRGLGFLIEFNSGNFNTTGSYAAIAILVAFSVILTELLTRLETTISRWRG